VQGFRCGIGKVGLRVGNGLGLGFGSGDVFDEVDGGLFVHVGGLEVDGTFIDLHFSLLNSNILLNSQPSLTFILSSFSLFPTSTIKELNTHQFKISTINQFMNCSKSYNFIMSILRLFL
jgi:hypothetical protein